MSNDKDINVEVHEGRKVGAVVSVRLKPEEADLLEALAERDNRSLSETLRVALHAYARNPRPTTGLMSGSTESYTRGGISLEPQRFTRA